MVFDRRSRVQPPSLASELPPPVSTDPSGPLPLEASAFVEPPVPDAPALDPAVPVEPRLDAPALAPADPTAPAAPVAPLAPPETPLALPDPPAPLVPVDPAPVAPALPPATPLDPLAEPLEPVVAAFWLPLPFEAGLPDDPLPQAASATSSAQRPVAEIRS